MNSYICKHCNKTFNHRKPNKIYCSRDCFNYSKAQTWKMIRECFQCKNTYIPSYKNQKNCSAKCGSIVPSINRSNSIIIPCKRCGINVSRRKSAIFKNVYCSRECLKTPTKRNCNNCGSEYSVKSNNWRKSKFCSRSCSKSGKFHHYYGKSSPTKGLKPWTFGLKKTTDPRLLSMGTKISSTQKEQFINGLRSNQGIKNPNYGRTPETRTPEQLNRYSLASIHRMQNSNSLKHKKYIRGLHYSNKIDKSMAFKSSFEKRIMVCLDKDPDIKCYSYESVIINYGNNKRYLPDFLIEYSNGKKAILEIKGYHLLEKEDTKTKSLAGENYCQSNNMIYLLYSNKDIKTYETKLGIIFSLKELKKELLSSNFSIALTVTMV